MSLEIQAKDYLLTKGLSFSTKPNLISDPILINVTAQPTMLRKLHSNGKVALVQIYQQDGKPVNKKFYVSEEWLGKGTAVQDFKVDPNVIVAGAAEPECGDDFKVDEEEPIPKVVKEEVVQVEIQERSDPTACNVLNTESAHAALYTKCYESIRAKLKFNKDDSSYKNLSKLYTLSEKEKHFMAALFTMYGEARGTRPPEENMASILFVLENRLSYAKSKGHTNANLLDVAVQNSQFSMFNPSDPNWKAAITADSTKMAAAIKVYAQRKSTFAKHSITNDVYHYATAGLCKSKNPPDWALTKVKTTVKEKVIVTEKLKARANVNVNGHNIVHHYYFKDVPWTFNPNNRYKTYAEQEGLIK
jgi:hypothetical protein